MQCRKHGEIGNLLIMFANIKLSVLARKPCRRSFPMWGMSLGFNTTETCPSVSLEWLRPAVCRMHIAPLQFLLRHQCFSVQHKLRRWWQAFPWGESSCSTALTSFTQIEQPSYYCFLQDAYSAQMRAFDNEWLQVVLFLKVTNALWDFYMSHLLWSSAKYYRYWPPDVDKTLEEGGSLTSDLGFERTPQNLGMKPSWPA